MLQKYYAFAILAKLGCFREKNKTSFGFSTHLH